MARVRIEQVSKVYDGNVTAVDNIDIDIADREFMVIVGPSGCGKTTTLRMVAGLEDITSGAITIGDTVVNDVAPKNRDIAMVFQNYALYPHMTVFQNMAFGLKLRKTPKVEIRRRVEEAAQMLGIDHLLDRKPRALSGGQRQRVALGRAIVRNPQAFLFDEPLSNLDAKLRVTTRADLKALHLRLQTTSIYVTHDQAEAMTLGDRICVMHAGRVQQIAPPMEVYNRPANKFVAGFLGTPPMNFFEVKVKYSTDACCCEFSDGTLLPMVGDHTGLRPYDGRPMVLGVRPEHFRIAEAGANNNTLPAQVQVIEPLGDRIDVYLKTSHGEKFIAALAPTAQIEVGATINIAINTERLHLFEPEETGRNVLLD